MSKVSGYGDDSPIAAFATTPGNSALTLIRCSGKGSIDLVSSVFTPAKLKQAEGNTILHGWIVSPKGEKHEKIDEVLVSVFRAPKSYTGEDSIDFCCHGGAATGKAVMAALKSAGFRDALPGEFTFRAFMNGKLDLTKSESVMELVSAKTDTSRRNAVARLSGNLQKEINEIKNMLVEILAACEIYLDYSEDEISADADEIAGRLPKKEIALHAMERLHTLADSWQLQRIYREGITAVIAGRPNSGKSSLFNCILKEDRSIVTEIPGTTRDWIEAWVDIEGIPVRLVDTAGLRDASDTVEKIGVERSLSLLQEAELILYLIDGAQGVASEDREFLEKDIPETQKKNIIFIWNKADISPFVNLKEPLFSSNIPISVSAKTGEGLAKLYRATASAIQAQAQTAASDGASVGTERQKNLVCAAVASLEEALFLAEQEEPLDFVAPLLRDAVNSLGEITGEVSTADILEEMFSKFCVGK